MKQIMAILDAMNHAYSKRGRIRQVASDKQCRPRTWFISGAGMRSTGPVKVTFHFSVRGGPAPEVVELDDLRRSEGGDDTVGSPHRDKQ